MVWKVRTCVFVNGDVLWSTSVWCVAFRHSLCTFKLILGTQFVVSIFKRATKLIERKHLVGQYQTKSWTSYAFRWLILIIHIAQLHPIHSHPSVNLHWLQMETLHSFLLLGYEFYWTIPVGLCMTQISLIPSSILKAGAFVECDQFIRGVWFTSVIQMKYMVSGVLSWYLGISRMCNMSKCQILKGWELCR